jgi:hypothetical protein
MEKDANINPAWDAFMGETTNGAVLRMIGAILLFTLAGGALAWLLL